MREEQKVKPSIEDVIELTENLNIPFDKFCLKLMSRLLDIPLEHDMLAMFQREFEGESPEVIFAMTRGAMLTFGLTIKARVVSSEEIFKHLTGEGSIQ